MNTITTTLEENPKLVEILGTDTIIASEPDKGLQGHMWVVFPWEFPELVRIVNESGGPSTWAFRKATDAEVQSFLASRPI